MTAIVLAGGPPDEVAAREPGVPNKAFVRVAGVALVERVIDALRLAPSIDRIIVVAPASSHEHAALARAHERRNDGTRITESLRSGLAGLPPDELVLVAASDLPILSTEAIEEFVAGVSEMDADLAYGCVEKRVHMSRYPEVPHTWAKLRDGTFCGGGLMAMKPRALASLERFIERLGAARKAPWKLAGLFGWDTLARYAVGRLAIEHAEARATALLGAPVRAHVSPHAETGVNVDRVTDIALAEALLAARPL
jgi:molybdopterin-guanine dinucleotide biosynthesis protein A